MDSRLKEIMRKAWETGTFHEITMSTAYTFKAFMEEFEKELEKYQPQNNY